MDGQHSHVLDMLRVLFVEGQIDGYLFYSIYLFPANVHDRFLTTCESY